MTGRTPPQEEIARLLRSRTGLTFAPAREAGFETGVARAMSRAGVAAVPAYAAALLAEEPERGSLLDDLLAEVTVGETYFFREPRQADFIRSEVLPDLSRRRHVDAPLRFWSAGCASGEEAYSLAILLEEEGLADRGRILATDICRAVLGRARAGLYGRWSLRSSDEAFTSRYFTPEGDRFRLAARFRERVTFDYLNLSFDSYPSLALGVWRMDLILCRNVLIYFDEATIRAVARRFFDTLGDGGWLLTGPSDPPLSDHAPFETVVTAAGVFYRRGIPGRSPAPAEDPAPRGDVRPIPVALPPAASPSPAAPPRPPALPPLPAASPGRETRDGPEAAAARVRALADGSGASGAVAAAAREAGRFPLSPDLHFLEAVLLMSLGRDDDAVRAVRRVLYLDRSLAVAHFVLGSLLARRGDGSGARGAYRKAHDLAAARPPDEVLPLSDGERASSLARGAAERLALLETNGRSRS